MAQVRTAATRTQESYIIQIFTIVSHRYGQHFLYIREININRKQKGLVLALHAHKSRRPRLQR